MTTESEGQVSGTNGRERSRARSHPPERRRAAVAVVESPIFSAVEAAGSGSTLFFMSNKAPGRVEQSGDGQAYLTKQNSPAA